MGGMAAQIPVRDDPEANEEAFSKVRRDKEREAGDGHDGTWVAHPGLVPAEAVCDGGTTREVADTLSLSPRTVEYHLGNAYRKLGVHNRTQLVNLLRSAAGHTRTGAWQR